MLHHFLFNQTLSFCGVYFLSTEFSRPIGSVYAKISIRLSIMNKYESTTTETGQVETEWSALEHLDDSQERNEEEREKYLEKVGEDLLEFVERTGENAKDDVLTELEQLEQEVLQSPQEILEGRLNERLLTVASLADACERGEYGINQYEDDFGDQTIKIYELKGMPFRMLSTAIDYRRSADEGAIGTQTYKQVMKDPGFWMQHRDEAIQSEGYGTRNANARGNTISTSYVYSEKNLASNVRGTLNYGFDHVENDSVISVSNGDGGTSNIGGDAESKIVSGNELDNLESPGGSSTYNEILLRRYSKDGMPKKPDYIICYDDYIPKVAKRHAAYYDIPIVMIDTKEYEDRAKWNGWELMNSINEETSFEETSDKLDDLLSMSTFKNMYVPRSGIGRWRDEDHGVRMPDQLQNKCREIAQVEFQKRLEFIERTLRAEIDRLNEANEQGAVASAKTPGLDMLSVEYSDVRGGVKYDGGLVDNNISGLQAPGACNSLGITIRMEGSKRFIGTNIYDGARPYDAEHANMSQEEIDAASSEVYDRLQPLAVEYLNAYKKNKEILKASLEAKRKVA